MNLFISNCLNDDDDDVDNENDCDDNNIAKAVCVWKRKWSLNLVSLREKFKCLTQRKRITFFCCIFISCHCDWFVCDSSKWIFFSRFFCSCTLIMTARRVASVRCVWQVANWIWTFAVRHVPQPQRSAPFGQLIRMEMLYPHCHRLRAVAATTMYHRHTMKPKSLHRWRHPVSVAH